jgi:hypothetical protein
MEALLWLKRHNIKCYSHVVINHGQLERLPEDGVPVEIASIIRHNPDEALDEHESAPYVSTAKGQVNLSASRKRKWTVPVADRYSEIMQTYPVGLALGPTTTNAATASENKPVYNYLTVYAKGYGK